MNWSDISHVNPYLTTFNMNKPDWFQEKKTFYSFKNLLHLRKLARALFQSFNFFSLSLFFFTLVALDVLNFDVFVALMKIY